MTSVPLTEEQVGADWLVLNVENVGLSDEQFFELCRDNEELLFELTAQKELIIATLPGLKTGRRNEVILHALGNWARQDGTGVSMPPPALYVLPNGSMRAPDASWIRRERWDALPDDEQDNPPYVCPDFVVELISPSDKRPVRFRMLQAKMTEYIENGAQLGWLIDPFKKNVYIYRQREPVQCLENPTTLHGDPVLPGFIFQIAELWQ